MLLLKTILHNLHQVLVAADQFLSTVMCSLLFPAERSYADETLSCRAMRWESCGIRSWPRRVIDAIFFWEDEHCLSSYRSEQKKKQLPPSLR